MKNFLRKTLILATSFAMALSSFNVMSVATVAAKEEVEYEIYPIPQDIEYKDGAVTLGETVNINFGSSLDDVTKQHIAEALAVKGFEQALEADFNFYVGSVGDGSEAESFVEANGGYTAGLMDKIDSYVIVAKDDTIAVLGSDTDGAFYGVTTVKHIFKQAGDEVRELVIEDYADTQTRGFIEGYYGIPWSDEDRMSLMEFGGEFKMTSYIFAPKDDPYHSAQWREPYPADRLAEIAEMVKVGNENKCRFVWTIHPFMNNRITEANYDNDLAAITNKFESLYEIGVRQFGVLADDSGNVSRSTVIRLMNDLQAWVDSKGDVYSLSFCPQGYNHSWQGNYGEINELDLNFHEDIDIFWTGEAVCKPVSQITLDHFRTYNNTTGKTKRRAPLFWLNWPVNDINMKRLMMGKGVELHADVNPDDLSGVVTNPMQEAEASKVALFAVADYAWNVNSFDDDQSWADSFKYIDENAGDALHIMASHLSDSSPNGHGQNLPESEYMLDAINDFKAKFAAGNSIKAEGEALIAQFEEIAKACDDFDALSTNVNLKEEINSWRLSLKDLSNAIINYIEAAIALENGDNSNVWANYSEGNALYNRSKEYTRLKINNVIDTVEAGSKVLIPFANTLSQSLNGSVAGILDPSKVIATFITNREDTPTGSIDNVFDNDPSTEILFKSPDDILTGEYVGVQYNRVITINDVTFKMGANSNDKDTIWNGKIQYMNENNEWIDIPGAVVTESNRNLIELNNLNLEAKAVRLIATADRTVTWFGVKDIIVNKDSIVKEEKEEALTGSYIYNSDNMVIADGSWANLTDGNNSSYAWSKSKSGDYMQKDAYVGINFGSAKRVGLVTLIQQDGSDGMKNLAVEYYDGSQWVTAASLTGCGGKVQYNLEGVTATQIRFRNTAQQSNWWQAHEISAAAFSANKNMYTDVQDAKTWATTYGDDVFVLNAGQSVNVPAGSYVGIDLGRLRQIMNIDVAVEEGFAVQWSQNGEVWYDYEDCPYSARYVRVLNTTNAAKAYTVEHFEVLSFEILAPHVEDTNMTIDGEANLFDKNRNTETVFMPSQTEGYYVTYDFGQDVCLDSFKAVSLDSNIDWIRHGKVSVSYDNENWEEIMTFGSQDGTLNPGEDTTTDNINDVLPDHEVTYNTKSVSDLGLIARYFKFEITQTKAGANKWVRFTEFELNNGEDFQFTTDPTVETFVETTKEYQPLNVVDGDYASSFRGEGAGSLVYTLDSDITRNNITILQSPTNAQDAMVKVYTYNEDNEPVAGLVGALSAEESLTKLVLPYGTRIQSIEITWTGEQAPEICEIILGTDEKAVAGVDTSALEAKIAEAEKLVNLDSTHSGMFVLAEAVEAAKAGKDLLTSEDMVEGVIAVLDSAMAALSVVDTAGLEIVVAISEMILEQSEYVFGPIGLANAQEALAEAKALLEGNPTQAEVDAMVEKLSAAMENVIVAPEKVEDVTAKAKDYQTITLTWDEGWEDATSYNVYVKAYDSKEFKLIANVTGTTYKFTKAMTGKEYQFKVAGVTSNDVEEVEGEASDVVKCTTKLTGTVKLNMKKVSTAKFELSWNKIAGATRYIVYSKRGKDEWKKVLTLGKDKLSYVTAELPNGEYSYIIRAARYDSSDRVMTAKSNAKTGTVEAIAPTLNVKVSGTKATLTWNKLEGVTYYQVLRKTSKEGKYTTIKTTSAQKYTTSVSKTKTYYFKVRGYKAYKSGANSKYNVYTPYSAAKAAKAK